MSTTYVKFILLAYSVFLKNKETKSGRRKNSMAHEGFPKPIGKYCALIAISQDKQTNKTETEPKPRLGATKDRQRNKL